MAMYRLYVWLPVSLSVRLSVCPSVYLSIPGYLATQSSTECRVYASVNWSNIGSGNDLSHVWYQSITWTNADLLAIGPLGTNVSENRIKIQRFHSRKYIWKCHLRNGGHFVQWEMSECSTLVRINWWWYHNTNKYNKTVWIFMACTDDDIHDNRK